MRKIVFGRLFRSLYFKVSWLIFTLVFFTSAAQLFVASEAVKDLGGEAEQQAHWEIATTVAERIQVSASPVFDRAKTVQSLFEFAQLNPNLAIFILDGAGSIVLHYPETGKLSLPAVPVRLLVSVLEITPPQLPILGPNPIDHRNETTLFSAARIELAGQPGYVYVTFTGLSSRTLMRTGQFLVTRVALIAVTVVGLAAILLGIAIFYLTTRRFRGIVEVLREFSVGEFSRRIPVTQQDEVSEIGAAINSLADSVVVARQALEQRDETRRRFVAEVSHDLRSPVAAMQLRIDLLDEALQENGLEQARVQVPAMQRSLSALQRLVADLFELTKIEAKSALKCESIVLGELWQAIVELAEPYAESCGVRITIVQDEQNKSKSVRLDPSLIQRLLVNLVENAIRYSPKGSTVTIRASGEKELAIEVEDQGEGIAEGLSESIFERGMRSAESTGAGLGLTICRAIAELHGGSLGYLPAPTGGAIFWVKIPLNPE